MTPTLILCVVIAQFAIGGIGLLVWKRAIPNTGQKGGERLTKAAEADSERCQVLFGNIGQLLNTHCQLLRYLDQADREHYSSKEKASFASTLAQRKTNCGRLLDERVGELSDVLEKYDDLYLHERLQLKDYADRAEQLENLLGEMEVQGDDNVALLIQLVRGMLNENRELRSTVEGCRSRITELITIAMKSGRDARVDALTLLPNRRAWIERLEVIEENESYAIAILDLDSFKLINDQNGHAAGDAVLRLISKILREETRIQPFRNGGDEFYVLVESRSAPEAKNCVENIRARVERASVLFDGKRLATTISGGVAYPLTGEMLDATIGRADKALYQAKSKKNCIVLCTISNPEAAAFAT